MKKISLILSVLSFILIVLFGIFSFIQNQNLKIEVSYLYEIISDITDENFVLLKNIDLNNNDKNETIVVKQEKIEKDIWAECPQGCEGSKLYITMYSRDGVIFKDFEFNSAVVGYPYEKNRLDISEGDITGDGRKELVLSSQTGSEFTTTNIILGFTEDKKGILQHFEYNGDTLFIKDGTLYGKYFLDAALDKPSSLRIYKWNGDKFDVTELK